MNNKSKTCGTCLHWKNLNEYNVGTCDGIKHSANGDSDYDCDTDTEIPTQDIAYVVDGSGYFAALKTRENFGCSLWCAKKGV